MVFSTGPTEENMKVAGKMVNSTELEPTLQLVVKPNKDNGKMAKGFIGWQVIIVKNDNYHYIIII